MTREEQDTERALVRAEQAWLLARGWTMVVGERYSHPRQPTAKESYTRRDAIQMTRADALRFNNVRQSLRGPA